MPEHPASARPTELPATGPARPAARPGLGAATVAVQQLVTDPAGKPARGTALRRLPGRPRRRLPASPASAVACGLLFFAALQLGLLAVMAHRRPDLCDPEYGRKLLLLRERRHEAPGRPLVLVLGSSRTEMGLRPDVLADGGPAPLVFNFGLSGAGPVQELLCLRRLLAEGVRPDHLFIEVLPALLQEANELARVETSRLFWRDLPTARAYSPDPDALRRQWWQAAASPWYAHRFCLMSHFARAWLPWSCRQDHIWRRMDRHGWLTYPTPDLAPEYRRQQLERAFTEYADQLNQPGIAANPDRALRELLALCRREGIPTTLLVMPESSDFRSWYPPEVRSRLDAYLARVSREHGVPLIDARTWVADDAFIDGHHLLPAGAASFTERFFREAVRPAAGRSAVAGGHTHPGTGAQ